MRTVSGGAMSLSYVAPLGRTWSASADAHEGLVLLEEAPLFVARPTMSGEATHGGSPADATDADVVAAARRDPRAAKEVLEAGFCDARALTPHDDECTPEAAMVRSRARTMIRETNEAAAYLLDRSDHALTADEVATVLQIMRLNSMALGGARGDGLFLKGSIFQHACASSSNVVFRFIPERNVMRFATSRPVAKGEALAIDYLGSSGEASRRVRRAVLLASKLFLCRCASCANPAHDLTRQVPCARCHSCDDDGLLAVGEVQDGSGRWRDSTYHAAVPVDAPPSAPRGALADGDVGALADGDVVAFCDALEGPAAWRCTVCGSPVQSPPLGHAEEVRLENIAHNFSNEVEVLEGGGELLAGALDDSTPEGRAAAALLRKLPTILEHTARSLGLTHWATIRLRAIQLEHWRALAGLSMDGDEDALQSAKEALRAIGARANTHFPSLLIASRDIADGALALHAWRTRAGFRTTAPLVFELIELALIWQAAARREAMELGVDSARLPALPPDLLSALCLAWKENKERARIEYGPESAQVDALVDPQL